MKCYYKGDTHIYYSTVGVLVRAAVGGGGGGGVQTDVNNGADI